MKKRKTNIKHHFVPQFYLKNFTNSAGKLCVYDFIRDNKYTTSPAKECYQKYFYDLDVDIFKMFSNSKYLYEEYVDDKIRLLNEEIAAILLKFLNQIKDVKQHFDFPRKKRDNLYNFIVLQIIRSPFYRSRLRYLNFGFCVKTGLSGEIGDEKTQDLTHNLLILGVLSRLHNQDFKFNKLYYTIFEHLIDEILDLKRQLENAGKLFLVNKSEHEFICTSTPVNVLWKNNIFANTKSLITTFDDKKLIDIGDYLEFNTIHLPVSSDVAIFIFDRNYSLPLLQLNQGIGIIREWNEDLLINLNYSSMLKNNNKIYSATGNYEEFFKMRDKRINPMFKFRFDG